MGFIVNVYKRGEREMKTIFALLIAGLTGCTSDFVYYLNGTEVYPDFELNSGPEFEWVEPLLFQHNLRICRTQPTCSVEQIFNRY